MPIVSNTSPVLNLAIVGRLPLLRQQFGEIWIPPAVLNELRVEEDMPGSQSAREAMEEGWLCVKEPGNRPLVHALQRDLDKGEAEAIALALQVGAEWTLLDEREGRRTAKSLGLKVTGILGILLRAWREGELPSLQRVMQDLREKAGFHIGAELFAELLRESGE
jgi:predicted nucleic acid-binding protein